MSVVIPTRNRKAYLSQAIESVLGQSYGDFEIIVVDDGSSDGTPGIVQGYVDARVRYVKLEGRGRSAARNTGMREANGAYIAFLDDDDLYLPEKLEWQVFHMETNGSIDLIASGAEIIDEAGMILDYWHTWLAQPRLTLPDCLYACPILPSTILIRTNILNDMDEWFDVETEPSEDRDFFIHLLLKGAQMAWLPRIVSAYRVHAGSSQIDAIGYSQSRIRVIDKLYARSNLPSEIQTEEPRVYGHTYMANACRCYAVAQLESAKENVVTAWGFLAQVTHGDPTQIVLEYIARFAKTFHVEDPRHYFMMVFGNLPTELTWLEQYRRQALSAYYVGNVFTAYERGTPISLRDWAKGVTLDRTWLLNRGMWSILLRRVFHFPNSLFGQSTHRIEDSSSL